MNYVDTRMYYSIYTFFSFKFAVPIEMKHELPWSTVAAMLNTKMEKLSSRKLSEENLEHLKQRIPGT